MEHLGNWPLNLLWLPSMAKYLKMKSKLDNIMSLILNTCVCSGGRSNPNFALRAFFTQESQ